LPKQAGSFHISTEFWVRAGGVAVMARTKSEHADRCGYAMFGQRKKRGLYYLLPGMNRSNRLRQRQILRWSIAVGLFFALLIGLIIWLLNSPRRYYW
jgi:hypothetical protein